MEILVVVKSLHANSVLVPCYLKRDRAEVSMLLYTSNREVTKWVSHEHAGRLRY